MRALTTATAAAVLGLERKAFDNLLLRLGPDVLAPGRQGVERRVPISLVEELMLCLELSTGLGVPAKQALGIAQQLMGRRSDSSAVTGFPGSLQVGPFLQLGADLAALRDETQRRCAIAIESVVRRPRGRPSVRRGATRSALPDLGDA